MGLFLEEVRHILMMNSEFGRIDREWILLFNYMNSMKLYSDVLLNFYKYNLIFCCQKLGVQLICCGEK